MKKYLPLFVLFLFVIQLQPALAQSEGYRYHLDLNRVVDDKIQVTLETPRIEFESIRFYMPNLIPGSYGENDFGQFISELKAFDKRGRELPVKKMDENSWQIEKAPKMRRLTYWVEDTYDSKLDHKVYGMSGTNIEADTNFVINSSGFFGYFDGKKELPFEVSITKPEYLYGSTGLVPEQTSATEDLYKTADYDLLIDSPMMYSRPDTTVMRVANADVLVSVYSPTGKVQSKFLAEKYKSLLEAEAKYLGGQLPVNKYAFIMYFYAPKEGASVAGAHEHSYSSLYYLPDMPQEKIASQLVDVASHEFFHIVTPLNLHSEEIAYFNYNKPVLSRHLWLYEGVTEYAAHHAQVKADMISDSEFLNRMAEKINTSRENYDEHLPFTELSKKAAGEYSSEYLNVYQKGALIGALLDIAILDATGLHKNLRDVLLELSEKYGKDKPFKDDRLFDEIAGLTDPQTGKFFDNYVAGPQPLPFKEYFAKAGVDFGREPDQMVATLGKVKFGYDRKEQMIMVEDTTGMNSFGRTMGYQPGDLLVSLQGRKMEPLSFKEIIKHVTHKTAEGDTMTVVVKRKAAQGDYREITLQAPAMMVREPGKYTLAFAKNPTYEQLKLRDKWLYRNKVTAHPKDVESIDAIISAMYEVISGPAGPRDWHRNASLFKPEAKLAAFGKNKEGELVYVTMTQEEYRRRNEPFFMKNDFWEEEIGRKVFRFGEMATVQTAYQFRMGEQAAGEENPHRGVNSVQLVYDQGRWWITNITWNSEREDNPIPKVLLTGKHAELSK